MQALTLSARQGWRWFGEGFRVFRRNPLLLVFLVFTYWAVLALINSVPMAGGALATLLMPLFSVTLMNACRALDQQQPLTPARLFAGMQESARTLLLLGLLYLLISAAILALSSLADGGLLLRWMLLGEAPAEEALASSDLLIAAQMTLLFMSPLFMAYWYAPVLVAWHELPAGKSLFFSLFACLRNWRAFLGYGAATVVFAVLVPGVLLGLGTAFLDESSGAIAKVMTLPMLMLLAPTLFASFYASYRDVFVVRVASDSDNATDIHV
ncbi:hypothetical protein HCX48_12190 [Rhodocyclus tenuis]|uniref:Transmembrane protein n=2 Tax=Rhodocyclus TaxID=1064 RepID=A0A6L5JZ34_RHOTE|nr:BPSS1780 family membrane protein [Rhodocyclus gracilis]MQY52573.1 hypothetical protein [Rhodocyclus gracilis]NJA89975.1 hypothetical protein [Rhodocyclus gracilis]